MSTIAKIFRKVIWRFPIWVTKHVLFGIDVFPANIQASDHAFGVSFISAVIMMLCIEGGIALSMLGKFESIRAIIPDWSLLLTAVAYFIAGTLVVAATIRVALRGFLLLWVSVRLGVLFTINSLLKWADRR